MKRLLPVLMGFALLLLTSTEGWSLLPCPGSYNKTTWTDCIGTDTYMGTKYVGEWKDGKRHGQGTETSAILERKYVGDFNNGLPNGQGTFTYADGSKYVGEWMDGVRREQVVMANLSIFRQIWYFDIA